MYNYTESDTELTAVTVSVRGDTGIADVWLRKNITAETDDEGGTRWTAEEAYMQYGYFDGLKETIEEDFDTYYAIAAEWQPTAPISADERLTAIEDAILEMSEYVYGS